MTPKIARAGVAVRYTVNVPQLHNHLFHVSLRVVPRTASLQLELPAWIPGSYLVREFAKNLQALRCTQDDAPLQVQQLDKASWRVRCTPGRSVLVEYAVYAFDASVRTAWLDASRGFFNGTSLFLKVTGEEASPHQLTIEVPPHATHWQCATALTPQRKQRNGFGTYTAPDYDTLVDCPVEMGAFWSGSFEAFGVAHRFVVSGAPDSFDGARLLADARAICEQEIRFWHGNEATHNLPLPCTQYLFMLNTVHDGFGGLEHRNSTALICPRKDLPRSGTTKQTDGYTTLMGLISHEYFHTWNVKRLRPAEFAQYDYRQENYTELLWFFEGFTSYYDDLLLLRAGRIDDAAYLKLLSKTINQVLQTPGRMVQSVAQASFDAWIKFYRQDENTANATVSYYTKGALVALCLDLRLRALGKSSLDAVMRTLWQRCKAGPMTEQDLLASLQECAGISFAEDIAAWVHGTAELPLQSLLEQHGIQYHLDTDQLAQQLGLRVKESNGITIQQVLRGGAAEQAGFAAGDEWLAVQAVQAQATGPWKIQSLDELPLYCGQAKTIQAILARDRLLHTLTLHIPEPGRAVRLGIRDAALARGWLG